MLDDKFSRIIDNMQEGYYEVDLKGNFTFVNKAVCKMLGMPKEKVIGSNYREFGSKETCQKVFKEFNKVYTTGEPGYIEYEAIRKDGARFIVANSTYLLKDDQGNIVGFYGLGLDITRRKEAEEKLRESEEKYRRLFESSKDAIMILEPPDWKFAKGNPAALDMFRLKGDKDFSYFCPWELSPEKQPDGRISEEKAKEMIRTALDKGSNFFEWVHLRDDGEEFPTTVLLTRVEMQDKTILQATIRDITEQKNSERKLKESENKFRSLVENAPGLIVTTISTDGIITYVNPIWENVLGYRRETVIGKNFKDFVKDVDNYRNTLEKICNEKKVIKDITTTLIHKDGSERLFIFSGTPELNSKGRVKGAIGAFRDITEQQRLQEQIHQSQKLEALGTLAGGIAHDFNNMLAGIIGYTDLTRRILPEGSKGHENLSIVLKAAERAKELVQQILTFSRQRDEERYSIQVYPIVKECLKLIRSAVPSSIKITENIDKDSGKVLASPVEIHQLVMNLCTNAYQAIGENQGVIDVTLSRVNVDKNQASKLLQLHKGTYVKLTVRDTGCGMDNKIKTRIFDPFFTTKGRDKGTGMGLATVHGIISSMKGAIDVQSEPGKGTTFDVYIPALSADKDASSNQVHTRPKSDFI